MTNALTKTLAAFMVLTCCVPALAQDPVITPPGQPEDGPGGSDYAYSRIRTTSYGEGAEQYWVFEPVDDRGELLDEALPIIAYIHGLNATDPSGTRGWINHMVRHGHIVIYPRYQSGGFEKSSDYTPAAADALRSAMEKLDGEAHSLGDPERLAYVGHSLGGTIIANLASNREAYELPAPRAMMSVLPGDTRAPRGLGALLPSLVEDMSSLPDDMLLLVVVAEDDGIVGDGMGKRIYAAAENIDADDKDFLTFVADDHGTPPLEADHFLPSSPYDRGGAMIADAMDFKLWALFDALTQTAFGDEANRDHALGNTPEQRSMGRWSDGTAVAEVVVTDEP